MTNTPTFLTPTQLHERWHGQVNVRTLANWRCAKVGPEYVKLRGRILYNLAAIEAYELNNTKGAK